MLASEVTQITARDWKR